MIKTLQASLFTCCLIVSVVSWAQPYHDNIWLSADGNDALVIDFSTGQPEVSELDIPWALEGASASICNAAGELQFYTNGCFVFNREHQMMDNGTGINPGEVNEDFCSVFVDVPRGYPNSPQSVSIIPWPNSAEKYLILHLDIDYNRDTITEGRAKSEHLYYTVVDMSANDGLGKVVEKNVLLDSTLREPKLALVRHANGRDWWMLNPLADNNEIQYYLIDSTGVHFSGQEAIGIVDDIRDRAGDQYTFSPQGDRLLRFSIQKGLSIFDFNRSTGRLSNFQQIEFPQGAPDEFSFSGVGVSPSGQFAYVSHVLDIYQYDLWADSIANTQIRVGEINNPDSLWLHPTGQLFQLGPDCKLYCYTKSGRAHHVIHNPDEPGVDCGWEQDAVRLPFPVFRDQPTFPNFRLGPLGDEGSPCSEPIISSTIVPTGAAVEASIFPNPAAEAVRFAVADVGVVEVVLLDGLGRTVQRQATQLAAGETGELSLAEVPTGPYVLRLRLQDGRLVVRKVVVSR